MNRIPITPCGFQRLKDELKHLKTEKRPKIVAAIEDARKHGDLSENAEYHAAKAEQGRIERRIRYIEERLMRFDVIDPARLSGTRIRFGATVCLQDVADKQENTYQIVGEDEASPEEGRISIAAPMARALIGKDIGDMVDMLKPNGDIQKVYIQSIEYIGSPKTE